MKGREVVWAAALVLSACSGEQSTPESTVRPVRVAEAQGLKSTVTQIFPGLAAATQEVNLSFRVDGPLIARVDVGEEVEEGAVLARLDPEDYALQVTVVEQRLEEERAQRRRAVADYRRQSSIQEADPGATSQKVVDRYKQAYDGHHAAVQALEAELRAATNQLEYTELRAPFRGRVTATFVDNYQDVQAKEAVLRLLDSNQIEMKINFPESSLKLLQELESISVHFDLMPDVKIPAKVKEVGTEASSVTRTFPVTLIMDQPEGHRVLPGMAGQASVSAAQPEAPEGVEVPVSALASDKYGRSYVWVIDKQTLEAQRRFVRVGPLRDHGIVLEEGVGAGDWVVSAGVHYLLEGQPVRLLRDSL